MKKILITALFLLTIFALSGCGDGNRTPGVQTHQVKEDLIKAGEYLNNSSAMITSAADSIESDAISIKRQSQDARLISQDPKVDPMLETIEEKSNSIIEKTDELRRAKSELILAESKIKVAENKVEEINDNSIQLKKERDLATKERDKLKEDISSHLSSLLRLIIGGSIIGIGVCGALAAFGNVKSGLLGASGCGITLVMAIVVGEHIALIGWIGLGVFLFCIGLLAFHIWNERKSIGEVVASTEKVKENLDVPLKEKIFGKKGEDGQIGRLQSLRTSNIVKKQKAKLKKKNGDSD